jgi:predicted N-formylglutamate amidohydrolase
MFVTTSAKANTVMQSVLRSSTSAPVAVHNRGGHSGVVLTCEHASNFIPLGYQRLGLPAQDLQRHIAWDIGALGLAEQMAALLDAPLVFATHSRLLLDLNRDPGAGDSIAEHSEDTVIPRNVGIGEVERRWRRDWLYTPFHASVDHLLDEQQATIGVTALLSIHSFTPTYHQRQRPWQVGIISQHDRRLSERLIAALRLDGELCVGENQPYAADDGVYHSMQRHGERRGLPCAMIEVRNDQISSGRGQLEWAARLAAALKWALAGLPGAVATTTRELSPGAMAV